MRYSSHHSRYPTSGLSPFHPRTLALLLGNHILEFCHESILGGGSAIRSLSRLFCRSRKMQYRRRRFATSIYGPPLNSTNVTLLLPLRRVILCDSTVLFLVCNLVKIVDPYHATNPNGSRVAFEPFSPSSPNLANLISPF